MYIRSFKSHVLPAVLLSAVFFASTSVVSAAENNSPAPTFGTEAQQSTLSCTSIRCRNRQQRRIFRAKCRLEGGQPRAGGCAINGLIYH